MGHAFLNDSRFYQLLYRMDQALAAQVQAGGCACGGKLPSARYPRKPRGIGGTLDESYPCRFSCCFRVTTLERCYDAARQAKDPVAALRPQRRRDAGRTRRLSAALIQAIEAQYRQYPGWTVLHDDKLVALAQEHKALGPVPGRPKGASSSERCAAMRPSTSTASGMPIFTMDPTRS